MGRLKKAIIFFCIGLMLMPNVVFAGEKKTTATKTYTYISSKKDSKSEKIKDEINIDGVTFKLKDVSYKSEPLSITKKVQTDDVSKLATNIKEPVAGKEYNFVAEKNITWKKGADNKKLKKEVEYLSKAEIPNTVNDGKYTLKLNNIAEKSRTETFTAPALFISYQKDADEYFFNGKKITITSEPIWTGYEADIKNYLGVNGANYSITGGRFTSDNILSDSPDGHYEKTASYTGTRQINYYLAEYNYDGDDLDSVNFSANVSYLSTDGYEVIATASYEKETFVITKIIIAGAGILILSTAAALLIYLAKKKKKKVDNAA